MTSHAHPLALQKHSFRLVDDELGCWSAEPRTEASHTNRSFRSLLDQSFGDDTKGEADMKVSRLDKSGGRIRPVRDAKVVTRATRRSAGTVRDSSGPELAIGEGQPLFEVRDDRFETAVLVGEALDPAL